MSVSEARGFRGTCRNCDRPATGLARLVRFSVKGERIALSVCRFCYVQLARHPSVRPPGTRAEPASS
jgi:hypothetical protein